MTKQQTALITGAAQRIGRGIALSLAEAGWDIAIHYHASEAPAQELARIIAGMRRNAWLVKADLSDADAACRIFPELGAQGVFIDLLINSAALFEKDSLAALAEKGFHDHMQINLLSPLLLIRDFAARYEGGAGNVINITDGLSGWSMSPAFLSYALSKQGLESATKLLAKELAPRIRINAIAPGATLEGKQDKENSFARLKEIIPLKRVSSPEEINKAIHFILASPSLTGQIFSLSGGMHSHV